MLTTVIKTQNAWHQGFRTAPLVGPQASDLPPDFLAGGNAWNECVTTALSSTATSWPMGKQPMPLFGRAMQHLNTDQLANKHSFHRQHARHERIAPALQHSRQLAHGQAAHVAFLKGQSNMITHLF
eukprot:scaffold85130_cov15-Tisochrysis_lutea.AAC.1